MRKQFVFGVVAAIAVAILPTVSAQTASADTNWATCGDITACGGMDALVAEAQKEGALNLTTILRNWADYGDALDSFKAAFGINIADDNPNGSSAYEINLIKTAPAATQPDVVDIGASHIVDTADSAGVSIFAPYKVQTWNDIPATWKDSTGLWFGNYSGQIVIGYNAKNKAAPKSFKDLLNPAFKHSVGIAGDPTGAQESLMTVLAASVANGGSLDNVTPGVNFFHKLKLAGNLSSAPATAASVVSGQTKAWTDWSFNAPGVAAQAAKAGTTLKYVFPSDAAVTGTPYIFGINKNAPHPASARLWVEFMMSEKKGLLAKDLDGQDPYNLQQGTEKGSTLFNSLMGGQNIFRLGGAAPILGSVMASHKVLVAAPNVILGTSGATAVPTIAQQLAAVAVLKTTWPKI